MVSIYTVSYTHLDVYKRQVMALAGASRIFNILDAEPEADDGEVTLVRGSVGRDGSFRDDKDGDWLWNDNGKYIPLRGDVKFGHVDFGYVPDKTVPVSYTHLAIGFGVLTPATTSSP